MSSNSEAAVLLSEVAHGGKLYPAPSQQFSDCLYNFAPEPTRFYNALSNKGFTLNYVDEDVRYLNIPDLEHLAIAMICFCDIPTERSRILPHLGQYGRYGIGISKSWGVARGVQPVHYLSIGSPFCDDLREAYDAASSICDICVPGSPEDTVSAFLTTTLAYAKPTYEERDDHKYYRRGYSYEDECEWRFVPRNLPGLNPVFRCQSDDLLDNYSHTLRMPETFLLRFEYQDITDLILPPGSAVDEMVRFIGGLSVDDVAKESLKMKIRTL